MKKLGLGLLGLLLLSIPVSAQAVWDIDVVHTNVTFTATHLIVSEVTGHFKDFSGSVTFTKPDFSDAQAEMIIKVASITTDNERRDGHLKTDDFFNAEKFPEIAFKAKSFRKTGENTYRVTGDFTMKGVTKTIELDGIYKGEVNAFGGTRMGWKLTGTINRFDYGLNWNKAIETGGLVVGKDIVITIQAELIKKQK
jgi:polyisoprenoid-binding protein YceI